ncbi:hypothetical protein QR680_018543 [Steinernema hermaphroditum]|uniref:Secreted protein n=1 Tax=Steinernema hermaphroditum TaxID=289476 RepID=A0AA39HIA8_9BILA|nr:hypothetical protein QR680_018543 [Steinernema hermaphroditum]
MRLSAVCVTLILLYCVVADPEETPKGDAEGDGVKPEAPQNDDDPKEVKVRRSVNQDEKGRQKRDEYYYYYYYYDDK